MKTLVIIPAYNEQDCIAQTVGMLQADRPDLDFVVINDGSSDRTKEICEEAGFPCISLPVNCGLATGFQTGALYARDHGYDALLQFDADGQHLPRFIAPMEQAMEERNADIVILSRLLAGEKPHGARAIGSKLISWLIKLTAHTTITDPTSGMRLYNRRMIEKLAVAYDFGPEPDTVAALARKGACVVEVPGTMQERQGGTSYLNFSSSIRYMTRVSSSLLLFQWLR